MKQTLMVGFNGILDTGQVKDKMMKDKLMGAKIVSRFRGEKVRMIKDAGGKFVDYSVSRIEVMN